MPNTKQFKTIEEQISILISRDLKFKSKEKAIKVLSEYNYFDVINGFESILLKKSISTKIYDNVYFEDFTDLFFFDMDLKKSTLFIFFNIEAKLRTSIAYNFAYMYCRCPENTLNYLKREYYKAPPTSDKHMTNKFNAFNLFKTTQYDSNGNVTRKSFIDELKNSKDYVKRYDEPPFWVTIKSLQFGNLYYTFIFLDEVVKEKVLNDFGFTLADENTFIQALFVLKEVRNQCAHLELITRFKLKTSNNKLNNLNEIRSFAGLSNGALSYLDVLKILKIFGDISNIKIDICKFYLVMLIKGRHNIANKALSKMGRKKLSTWISL